MATKSPLRWCAVVALVGGVLILDGVSSWAADAPASGKTQTIPAPAPTVAPTTKGDQLQPIPESPQAVIHENGALHEGTSPSTCGDESMNFCGVPLCSPPGRFWFRTDALMWWTNGTKLPPLVTTSPQGTPIADAGVLGLSTTTILYGNQTIGNDARGGVRATFGMWLDCCKVWNLEFDYFTLGDQTNSYDSGYSGGNPILTRPFFNVQTNSDASEMVAYTGTASGAVTVNSQSSFYSTGVLLSYNLCSNNCGSCEESCEASCETPCDVPRLNCCRTDLLIGFRYCNLSDSIVIHENPTLLSPTTTHTTLATYDIHDNFRAKNEFYGSEIGLRTQIYRGRWSLGVQTKVAMGNTHQTVTIDGTTVVTPTGGSPTTYYSGILANDNTNGVSNSGGSNCGTWQRDDFTVIPQLGLELGYQVTRHFRAYVGYDVFYWACVQKSAEQISLDLDPRNFPPPQAGGTSFPTYPDKQSSFWAQGISLGGEFRF